MPTFVYLGLPEGQKQAMIETHMEPLMDDEAPHPRFGGFPLPAQNEVGFYDHEDDKPKVSKLKAKKREKERDMRRKELEEKMAQADAMMTFTVGRVPGKLHKAKVIEFPKGKPVEVSDMHTGLVAKLRALAGQEVEKIDKYGHKVKRRATEEPLFEEVTASEPEKRGPGRPPKAKE